MSIVGKIESLWRYPVKSMRGEELAGAFVGFAGISGDRLFAFKSSARPQRFPYLTGREQPTMLLYRPRFRTSLVATPAELAVEVETPTGEILAVDDPALGRMLAAGLRQGHMLTLLRSERALTDCHPLSLFSLQTARRLGAETGATPDKRRFRANVYLDLGSAPGFAEDGFVGRKLRLGAQVVLAVVERDPRCKMITLDPDTAEPNPDLLRKITRDHEGKAGVYATVLVEGPLRPGDAIELLS